MRCLIVNVMANNKVVAVCGFASSYAIIEVVFRVLNEGGRVVIVVLLQSAFRVRRCMGIHSPSVSTSKYVM